MEKIKVIFEEHYLTYQNPDFDLDWQYCIVHVGDIHKKRFEKYKHSERSAFVEGLEVFAKLDIEKRQYSDMTKSKCHFPDYGIKVLAKVQHWFTKNIKDAVLVRVDEDDLDWRFVDDHSELSYDWNVIAWEKYHDDHP